MPKPNYRICNRGNATAEIYLYDQVGQNFWGDGISAKQFAEDLKALGRLERINLRINSPGGDLFDGLAIYNELARHPARVEVDVDGLAASIASIIAMAGNEIRMADNAMMMIHDPQWLAIGNSVEMRRCAEILDQTKESLVNTYAKVTSLDNGEISELMTAETWFTARQAVESGFAHRVTDAMAIENSFDLSKYKRVPRQLLKPAAAARPLLNVRAARFAAQSKYLSTVCRV